MTGLRLLRFRENLSEWVDFDPFKDTVDCIGIFTSKPLRIFQRVCFDDDQTSCLIRERTGQHDPSLHIERFHLGQMRRTIDFSLGFSVGAVKSEDDKFHEDLDR